MTGATPPNFDFGKTYTLSLTRNADGSMRYDVVEKGATGNAISFSTAGSTTIDLDNVILQGHNTATGRSYTITWDNLTQERSVLSGDYTGNSTLSSKYDVVAVDGAATITGVQAAGLKFVGEGTLTVNAVSASDFSASSIKLVVNGTSGNDVITGGDKNDTISGGAGNDTITGGSGNDTINGGAGNDIIWGDNPNNTALTPALYGDDVINGGSGSNVIVLGTKSQNVKLGGQDTIILDAADAGTNVVFNFNFGPTDRVDGLSGGVDVPNATDADKTFDIVKFSNVDKSAVKFFVGQENAAYQDTVTGAGGPATFSGNTFSLAGNTVYAGNTDNLELKVQAGNSQVIFANAISKWELGGLLGKDVAAIQAGDLSSFITELNTALDGGASAGMRLEELNEALTTKLLGFLETQGNFHFVA